VQAVASAEDEAGGCFRAIRLCDELLATLASYDERDGAIERWLELAIMDERSEALLRAREFAAERAACPV
jgi:hypothetical protein